MAWPEPLCSRPHAPTPVWLVTTDDQCTRATEQAQLQTEWVIMQVGAGQPRPRGLPHGTALLVATEVPHDPHMAVHTLEDQPEDTGHLVVHQRGGPAWLRERVRSWASTIVGAEVRGGVPRVHRARSPVPPRLPRFANPRSVHQFAAVAAGAYPPRCPPNAWSPGAPAPPGPCYWLVASGTPLG